MRNKETTKDYSINAFRFYAEQGKPTYVEIKNMCDKSEAELNDLFAAQKVYSNLDEKAKKIIEIVYLENPYDLFNPGQMKIWITDVSKKTPIVEKRINAILKAARLEFAKERGMRI